MKSSLFVAVLCLALGAAVQAQEPRRPKITGISHAAFYVSGMAKARELSEGFLGFQSPFPVARP